MSKTIELGEALARTFETSARIGLEKLVHWDERLEVRGKPLQEKASGLAG